MQCCKKNACENCLLTKMCSSIKSVDGCIPEGNFRCGLCESNIYGHKGLDKHLLITVNEAFLELMDFPND